VTIPAARRAALRRRLLAWYDASRRPLPWRFPQGAADPYRVWVAEVMLQQTRVDAVVPYYERFLARFPTLQALAGAADDEVLALWSGLGYYARARNLARAAREATARHGGLPASLEALRALPGFGPYTAGAVASIAFGIRAAAVDGNAARVLARAFLVDAPRERAAPRIAALAGALVAGGRAGELNQALMDLGATLCRKPAPACDRCPIHGECLARRRGREREIPPARRRARPTPATVACAVVRRGARMLVSRRGEDGLFGGLWELPSAEVAAGEDAAAALRRALRARGLDVRPGAEVARVERTLSHRALTLRAFRCDVAGPTRGGRFAGPDELARLGMATAMRRLVEAVLAAQPPPAPASGEGRGSRSAGRTSA
jgi:A/G-specific adenine glycosylase